MDVTLVLRGMDHPAIEERYASWQNELLLRRAVPGAAVVRYAQGATAREALAGVATGYALVVTDPISVPSPSLPALLATALQHHPEALAALPVTNQGPNPHQVRAPAGPYLTLRQFEAAAEAMAKETAATIETEWDGSDPAIFLVRTQSLLDSDSPIESALEGRAVLLVTSAYAHRYSSQRGQLRGDILERIDPEARAILEFGCGEAELGAAVKRRQECRVTGIEIDPAAAEVARTRIDEVLSGDVQEVIGSVRGTFDCIVGGDIVEHLQDPWSFLRQLRRVAAPGGRLILSLPNVASWPIIADLLRGRLDYVYMGITCVGHLRFFTRRSIEELLAMTGWTVASIEPQERFITPEWLEMEEKLGAAGIEYSAEDLVTPGYYVTAVAEP